MKIDMQIKRLSAGFYIVETQTNDNGELQEYNHTYEKSNSIFPLFRSLVLILRELEGVEVEITSNSDQFNEEMRTLDERNTSLVNMISDTVERNNLTLKFS